MVLISLNCVAALRPSAPVVGLMSGPVSVSGVLPGIEHRRRQRSDKTQECVPTSTMRAGLAPDRT
jgi:hypothetical protein